MIISGEAGKGKSYLMKLVENMLHKGQVRTVHRASACSKDEGMLLAQHHLFLARPYLTFLRTATDVGQCIEVYHEAAPQAMNKSNGKNDNDQVITAATYADFSYMN